MTDIERAREIAASTWAHWSDIGDVQVTKIRKGLADDAPVVQSAMLAIQAERERAKVVVDALQWVRKNNGPNTVVVVNEALAKWEAGNV